MATHTWVDLHIPEAQLLADLTGIKADLSRAKEWGEMLTIEMSAGEPHWSLEEPLSVAIAIAYSRAFVSGVRTALRDEDLSVLTPAQRIAHNRLRAFRDKHVSHSVNAFEKNQPRAQYCVDRVQTEGITRVDCSHGRVSSLSSVDIENIAILTTALLQHVQGRIAKERAKLLASVRKKPLEELLSGNQGGFRVNSGSRIDKARKK